MSRKTVAFCWLGTLPSAKMCIYLSRSAYPCDCSEESDCIRFQASELSLISSKTFALPPARLYEEVDRGRVEYATICDKSDCFGSTVLFFFEEPIHERSTQRNSIFFNFKKKLY